MLGGSQFTVTERVRLALLRRMEQSKPTLSCALVSGQAEGPPSFILRVRGAERS